MSQTVDLTEAIVAFLSSTAPLEESVQKFMADIGGMTVLLEILVNTPVSTIAEGEDEEHDSLADPNEVPQEKTPQLDPDLVLADTITRIAMKVLSIPSARSLLLSAKASALIGAMLADAVSITEIANGNATDIALIPQPMTSEVHNSLRAGVRLHGALILLKGIYQAIQDAVRASAGSAEGLLLPAATHALLVATLRSQHSADAPLVELCTDILALEAHYSAESAQRFYSSETAKVLLVGGVSGEVIPEGCDPFAGGLGVWALPSEELMLHAGLVTRGNVDPSENVSGIDDSEMMDDDLRIPGVDDALRAQAQEKSSELTRFRSFSMKIPFSRSANAPKLVYELTFAQIACPDTLRARAMTFYLAPLIVTPSLLPPSVAVTHPLLADNAPVPISLSSLRILSFVSAIDALPLILSFLDPTPEQASTHANNFNKDFVTTLITTTSIRLRTFAQTLSASIGLTLPSTTSNTSNPIKFPPPHVDPLSSLVFFDILSSLAKSQCGLILLNQTHIFNFLFRTLHTLAPAEPTAQRTTLHGVQSLSSVSSLHSDPRLMLDSDEEEETLANWTLRGYGSLWVSHCLKTVAYIAEELSEHPFPGYTTVSSQNTLRDHIAYAPSALGWLLYTMKNDNLDKPTAEDSLAFIITVANLLSGYVCIPSLFSVVSNTIASLASTLPDKLWLWMPHATVAILSRHYTASAHSTESEDPLHGTMSFETLVHALQQSHSPSSSTDTHRIHQSSSILSLSPARASVVFTLLRLWHTYHDERRASLTHTLAHIHTFTSQQLLFCARGSATGLAPLPRAITVPEKSVSENQNPENVLLSLFSILPHLHLYAHCSFAAPQPPSHAVFTQLTSPVFIAYSMTHAALTGDVLTSLETKARDAPQRLLAAADGSGSGSAPAIAALMRGATDQGMNAVLTGAQSVLQELHFAYLHWMLSMGSDSALAPLLFKPAVEAFLLAPPHACSEATTSLTLAWQQKIAKTAVDSVETEDKTEDVSVMTGMRGKLPHGPMRIVANRYAKLARDGFSALVSQLRVMDPVAQTG